MTFGEALMSAQGGQKIRRSGWNGKGMWVALTPASTIPVVLARSGAARHLAAEKIAGARDLYEAEGMTMEINAHLDRRAADGSLVIGWLASQTNMLADDWTIVSDPA